MFGGFDHLSNAAEAKSRKKREQKQAQAAEEENDGEETEEVVNAETRSMKLQQLRVAAAAAVTAEIEAEAFEASQLVIPDLSPAQIEDALLELTAGHDHVGGRKDTVIPKEDLLAFFKQAHTKLRSAKARAVLRSLGSNMNTVSETLVKMQRSCFVPLDIDVAHGCHELGEVEVAYPYDFEMMERKNAFLDVCRICFLTAIDDTMNLKKKQIEATGSVFELQNSGSLTKEQILLFIEVCSVALQTNDVFKRMRETYVQGAVSGPVEGDKAAANECLIIQYESMKRVGFEQLFGVQQLNQAQINFPDDRELMMKMSSFAQLCQQATQSAAMSKLQHYNHEHRAIDNLLHEAKEEAEDAQRSNLQNEGVMSREKILEFFALNMELFDSTETKSKLRKLARTSEGIADLNRVMVEMQKSMFTKVGVTRKVGNETLASISSTYAGDTELHALMQKFALKCSYAWIEAVRTTKPKKMQKNGRLSRTQLMNFLDGIQALLVMDETRKTLRDAYLSTNDTKLPAELSVKMQRELLETLGIEANFGVSCLNRVGKDYGTDREVIMKMQKFQQTAQQCVMLSTMSEEQLANAQKEDKMKQLKAQQHQAAMQERSRQVQLAVAAMSPEDKENIKQKMSAKWSTLMRLPQQDKMSYLNGLPDHDQIDFAMMSAITMQEKFETTALNAAGAKKENPSSLPLPPSTTAGKSD